MSVTKLVDFMSKLERERQSIYLARNSKGPVFSQRRDNVTVLGIQGCGKSSRFFSPSVAVHPGPVIVTSIRTGGEHPDVRDVTLKARQAIAEARGGRVLELVIDDALPTLATRVWWDMTDGCSDWDTALDRAGSLSAAGIPASGDHYQFWRDKTAGLLAPMLFTAAISDPPLRDVHVAQALQSGSLDDWHEALYNAYPEHRATSKLYSYVNTAVIGAETLAGVFATINGPILGALDYTEPAEMSSFRLSDFLSTYSTIYITARLSRAKMVKPLIAAFVEAACSQWSTLPVSERPPSLLLALDEVANVAPIDSLPSLLSAGGGSGIQTLLGLQNPAQADKQWGSEGQAVIAGATHLVLFPGLKDNAFLSQLAELCGRDVRYQFEITVAPDTPTGARFANSEWLIHERQTLEDALAASHPMRKSATEKLVAAKLDLARKRKGLQNRISGPGTEPILRELNTFTRSNPKPDRRQLIESSDLFRGQPDQVFVFSGPKYEVRSAYGWHVDPLWSMLLT